MIMRRKRLITKEPVVPFVLRHLKSKFECSLMEKNGPTILRTKRQLKTSVFYPQMLLSFLSGNVMIVSPKSSCLFWSLTIILRSAKIFLKLYLSVVLWRTKLKAPSQSLCLKRQINLVVFPQTPSLWEEPPWKGTLVPILYEEMLA